MSKVYIFLADGFETVEAANTAGWLEARVRSKQGTVQPAAL